MTEIQFPIEFLVYGTPVSAQTKRPESRDQWKERVKLASCTALPEQHLASNARLAVTLYYFPDAPREGDVDNIVKYTLDGLTRHVYMDDSQVERVVVQKFEPERIFPFRNPTEILVEALTADESVLYILLSDDPHGDLA